MRTNQWSLIVATHTFTENYCWKKKKIPDKKLQMPVTKPALPSAGTKDRAAAHAGHKRQTKG